MKLFQLDANVLIVLAPSAARYCARNVIFSDEDLTAFQPAGHARSSHVEQAHAWLIKENH